MAPRIASLTPATVEDFFTFFDRVAFRDHPEWGCGCYCRFFHATDADVWEKRAPAENAAEAREAILAGTMRGLLAYDGATPVGWCHFDLLTNLPGLGVFYPGMAAGGGKCAAIVCFTVAQGYRRQGVAACLLKAALALLKAEGVTRVEAYPAPDAHDEEHHYHGPAALYAAQGFVPEPSQGALSRMALAL